MSQDPSPNYATQDKKRPERRSWRRRLIYTLTPLLLIVIAVWVWDTTGSRRLERAYEQARANGRPLTYDEIFDQLPTLNEDENAAIVFDPLIDRLNELDEEDVLDDLPVYARNDPWLLGTRLSELDLESIRDVLDEQAEQIRQIKQLADYKAGRFAFVVPANPSMISLPHQTASRVASKLVHLDILADLHGGDTSELVRDLQAMRGISSLFEFEPDLVSKLIQVAIKAYIAETVQRAVSLIVLSPEQLASLQELLIQLDDPEVLYLAMLGERAFFLAMAEHTKRNARFLGSGDALMPWAASFPLLRGFGARDYATSIEQHNRRIEATLKPPHESLKIIEEIEAHVAELPFYCLLTKIMVPSLHRTFVLTARQQAETRAAIAGLAAERYRLDHGQWPESLDALVPAYLDAVPTDPFTGEPLKMTRTDRGWLVIYSVGEDETDDGGMVEYITDAKVPADWGFVLIPVEQRGRRATEPPATDTNPF